MIVGIILLAYLVFSIGCSIFCIVDTHISYPNTDLFVTVLWWTVVCLLPVFNFLMAKCAIRCMKERKREKKNV